MGLIPDGEQVERSWLDVERGKGESEKLEQGDRPEPAVARGSTAQERGRGAACRYTLE